MALQIGDEFNSFEEFEQAFISYKKTKFMDFAISDSRTLTAAKKTCPKKLEKTPKNLKYYFVKYTCIHGGVHKKRKTCLDKRVTSLVYIFIPNSMFCFILLHNII